MPRPTIEPVTPALLPKFARFLHENLQRDRSPQQWEEGLRQGWAAEAPNHGFALLDGGEIVGGIGAFYADRTLAGRAEKFCNITSWCVLDAYRQQSMRLAMAVINQPGGYTFTDFSPTKVVGSTLKFFKFQELDERVSVYANLPVPWAPGRVLTQLDEIGKALGEGQMLQAFRDHAAFAWLHQLLLGEPGHWCHVIYKRRSFKGLPSAHLLHLSDGSRFSRYARRLGTHLLARGMASTHVEVRMIDSAPWPTRVRSGFNRKVYLSSTVAASEIDYLYSETVALDL